MPRKDPDARREYERSRPNYAERKRKQNERRAAWRSAHPVETRVARQKYMLMWLYGLTPDQYKEMYDRQDGKCANHACVRPAEYIDHNHQTNEVRGLLCKQCNFAIGLLNDSIQMSQGIIVYLKEHDHASN